MVMPKMGESIMEGTILKWLKKEGDIINEDESVLEVATDKVDTEIPSTCSGKLSQILVKEGDIVKVGSPIALIETESSSNKNKDDIDFATKIENNFSDIKNDITELPEIKDKKKIDLKSEKFFSPLVLNIASRENISLSDLEKINGTGENSRVTKYDLLKFLEDKNHISIDVSNDIEIEKEIILKDGEEIIEPDRVRKIIADRMVQSKRISPHVTSFVEADITNVFKTRKEIKDSFLQKKGLPLTFNTIFIKSVSQALKDLL